jgi:hypothetical protein
MRVINRLVEVVDKSDGVENHFSVQHTQEALSVAS